MLADVAHCLVSEVAAGGVAQLAVARLRVACLVMYARVGYHSSSVCVRLACAGGCHRRYAYRWVAAGGVVVSVRARSSCRGGFVGLHVHQE